MVFGRECTDMVFGTLIFLVLVVHCTLIVVAAVCLCWSGLHPVTAPEPTTGSATPLVSRIDGSKLFPWPPQGRHPTQRTLEVVFQSDNWSEPGVTVV
jgi:hypothetical protein